jgi:hypothetical protein
MKSAATSLAIFFISTVAYFIAKHFLIDGSMSGDSSSLSTMLTVGYLIIVVGSQIGINISNTAELCNGTPQVVPAIMYTILPNFFIFGTLILLLSVFPGWKAPFSNTIGYLVVSLFMGVKGTFNNLFDSKGSELIDKICSDHSMIINEITHSNWDSFLARMATDGILKKNYKDLQSYKDLWQCISVKNNIADFIWYILTGALVITTTYNALLDIKCSYSTKQSKENANKFAEQQVKLSKTQKPVFYTSST